MIPAAARRLDIPVIASGGIADGQGTAAALALRAEGVNMGTRFMLTREAPLHDNIKQLMVGASERDTSLIFRTFRNTARVFRNQIADHVVAKERQAGGVAFEEIRPLVAGARGREALETGDKDRVLPWAGLCLGLIDDIPTCAELIERMETDCAAAAQSLMHRLEASPAVR